MSEIIVDNFAGGGGASTGIELAIGRSVDIAINHDPAAIAMHKINHPETEHYVEDVWEIDPVEVTKGRPVALAWFSPDCKHFSKAKGGKPVDKKIRGLAWVAVKWAKAVKPRVIMLENVEEFKQWGPLKNNYPDPDRKGETFELFVKALQKHGYQVDFRELRASDYGAPTIRKRFFMIARSDGKPIKWPEPTHGDPESKEVKSGKLKPWRTAAEIIDWSIPVPSIFARKKPLAENTIKRIVRGIQRFVIDNPKPYIVRNGQMNQIDISNRFGLVAAFISRQFKSSVGHKLDQPLGTITTVDKSRLVTAFLLKYYGSDIGQSLDDPLHTITTKDRFGLVTVQGQKYRIVDIGMRMLQPHELYAAQGFPNNYIIDKDCDGNSISKKNQVAMCGNSVPPPFAEHLVRANLPEISVGSGKQLIFERYKETVGQLKFTV